MSDTTKQKCLACGGEFDYESYEGGKCDCGAEHEYEEGYMLIKSYTLAQQQRIEELEAQLENVKDTLDENCATYWDKDKEAYIDAWELLEK